MYRRSLQTIIISLFLAILSVPSWAWNQQGHRLIGEIAYQHLYPEVKQKVLALLHQLDPYYGHTSMSWASSWADRIRGHDIGAFNQWHYINQPYSPDHSRLPPVEQQNVVWAIGEASTVIQSKRSNALEKALFLSFLLHEVGDVHQPLHCIVRVSQQHPQGDLGGNFYGIRYGQFHQLHALWDGGVGLFADEFGRHRVSNKRLSAFAISLTKAYPPAYFRRQLTLRDPRIWAQESFELSKQYAYAVAENTTPSAHYIKDGQEIARLRLLLAGYRLSCLLNSLYGRNRPCIEF